MNILFIHQNFPAQYKHLAPALAARGHQIVALGATATAVNGMSVLNYKYPCPSSPSIHRWAADFETKTIRAEGCAKAMLELRDKGFVPDVVCAHPGWGESLLVKDIFYDTKVVSFHEFYYHPRGVDLGFDPEFEENSFEHYAKVRLKNTHLLVAYEDSDKIVTPTEWQKAVAPEWVRAKTDVVFDGIDTDMLRPNDDAFLELNGNIRLTKKDEIITFVNRNLEPYRGWHIFARALPLIQAKRPNAYIVIVGGDGVSYGAPPKNAKSWKEQFWSEVSSKVDASKIIFLGQVPYNHFISILQISTIHVYLTFPFVLSWSLMEAMSCGAVVVGSATRPVQEVIEDGKNGFLVDFFDIEGLAERVTECIERRNELGDIRQNARETVVARYDLKRVCLPRQIDIVEGAVGASVLS